MDVKFQVACRSDIFMRRDEPIPPASKLKSCTAQHRILKVNMGHHQPSVTLDSRQLAFSSFLRALNYV